MAEYQWRVQDSVRGDTVSSSTPRLFELSSNNTKGELSEEGEKCYGFLHVHVYDSWEVGSWRTLNVVLAAPPVGDTIDLLHPLPCVCPIYIGRAICNSL